ncbi:MAG: hypothetical protein A2511_09610 [Deltaproteobacteria bacterium RIFOXYD12_FULL_50_9]|nr:MAG: hypothetical protein A2511_09610 [Deltaproteobacteria bacterium RIFOXYD12_FULL_50_9]
MKKQLMAGLAVGLFSLGVAGIASATSFTVGFNTGSVNTTTALTGYSTDGAMMDGMGVTAFFAGGSSQTLYWADLSPTSGGVSGLGWSLSESGDTYGGNWSLTSTSAAISKIAIDAGIGNTVFDTLHVPDPGTPGSANGYTLYLTSPNMWDIAVTYSNEVALTAFLPVGDLYRSLSIDFLNNINFGPGQSLTFVADTDNLSLAGDLKPVPEPATMLLFGTGLAGLAGFARRRVTKKA